MDKDYCVYKHTCPNGKVYIGVTKQKPSHRWKNGCGYKTQAYFYRAILKYGWKNIKHEVLCENLHKEEAEKMEMDLIKTYKSNDCNFGYNVREGGMLNTTEYVIKEETHEKLRLSHIGEKNSFYGKHHSEENKLKQSERMKGNSYFKNHCHSQEFKKLKSKQMKLKYSNGGNPRCKTVKQFDDNKNLINVYFSLRKASECTNIPLTTLSIACRDCKMIQGSYWSY